MMNKLYKILKMVLLTAVISLLTSCGGNNAGGGDRGGGGISTNANLIVDNISTFPIVNGQPTNYGVYIENIGTANMSGLSFSISNNASTDLHPVIDVTQCNNIAAGSSCKINITTTGIGNITITGRVADTDVISFTLSTYPITINSNLNLANALILSEYPTSLVVKRNSNTGNYFGALNVNVINNYNSAVDVEALFGILPNNVVWSPVNCPNPLPTGGICQVRFSYNGNLDSNITVNLNPSGQIKDKDGNMLKLPTQNSQGSFIITNSDMVSLNISAASLILNGNSPTTNNTTTAVIINTGTAAATISNITINNNSTGVFSISNNQCIGQLAPNATCRYTITANVAKLADTPSGNYSNSIIVNYSSTTESAQSGSSILSYRYTALTPSVGIPNVQPSLQLMGVLPSSLYGDETQTIPLTLKNNSTATNGGDSTLIIAANSLTENLGTNLSGKLDTSDASKNTCAIDSNHGITLPESQSCIINLKLTANISAASDVLLTITPHYQYNTYASESVAATKTDAVGTQLQSLSGVIVIQERAASLNLAYYTDFSYTIPINNLSAEQGAVAPSAILRIINTGNTALTGITLPTVANFMFTPDSSCNTLAVGASCKAIVTLSTDNVIAESNLNVNSINYTYLGSHSYSTNLPSLTYQVTSSGTPIITSNISFVRCGIGSTTDSGNSSSPICYLNPSASGTESGLTSAYQLILTYTNTGNANAIFNATPKAPDNYIISENQCNNTTLAAGTGSCSIIYQLISPDSITNANIAQNVSLSAYSYTYGSNNQLSGNGSTTNPSPINISITNPSLSLSVESEIIPVGGSTIAKATISNWYVNGNPSAIITSENSNIASVGNLTCNNSICTATITGKDTGGTLISAMLTAPGHTTITSNLVDFMVGPLWQNVGNAGFSAGSTSSISLALNSAGTPYVAYKDGRNFNKATVMTFNGYSWINLGNPGFSSGTVNYVSLALNSSGIPYIAYMDTTLGDKITVMKFTGESWANVGNPGFSAGGVFFVNLAINTQGVLYVVYEDQINDGKATVMKFTGESWVNVGNPGFSGSKVSYTSIAFDPNGDPYVAYFEQDIYGATVMRFNGESWVNVGNPGFSSGQALNIRLQLDSAGIPYVAYVDVKNGDKATVMKFAGDSWVSVGNPDFSIGTIQEPSLALGADGNPYVAYVDMENGGRATVMQFNGTAWINVGSPGFSIEAIQEPSLVLGANGNPYVAYVDVDNGAKATLMNYITP